MSRRGQGSGRKPAKPAKSGKSGKPPTSGEPTLAEERAAAQAGAGERRAAERARLDERFGEDTPGSALIVASWVSAAAVTLTGLAGWAFGGPFEIVALVVSLTLFFAGMVICSIGFVVAASRSRRDQLDLGRLTLLTGIAPRRVRNSLFGALALQIVGGLVPAIATQGLELDFGTLVPLVGVGLIFWWGAAYGDFPPRPEAVR